MLINTVYLDEFGEIQHQLDRGTNRRILTRETEQGLPHGSRIIGVVIVNEGGLEPRGVTLRAV